MNKEAFVLFLIILGVYGTNRYYDYAKNDFIDCYKKCDETIFKPCLESTFTEKCSKDYKECIDACKNL